MENTAKERTCMQGFGGELAAGWAMVSDQGAAIGAASNLSGARRAGCPGEIEIHPGKVTETNGYKSR